METTNALLHWRLAIAGLLWTLAGAQFQNSQYQYQNQPFSQYNRCSPQMVNQIRSVCAKQLAAFRVFNTDPMGSSSDSPNAMTWDSLRRQSRSLFEQICRAFEDWDRCVTPYKAACFYEEPVKGEYTVAHEALAYACRPPAYQDMLNNWDCFLQASTRSDLIMCDAQIMADARGGTYTNLREGDTACRILQDYVGCIREPIYDQCGPVAWRHVREVFQRPTRVYLPYCTLKGMTTIPSMGLILVAFGLLKLLHSVH